MASTETPLHVILRRVTLEISDLEELFRAVASSGKEGISPAAKAAIEAMPTVKITEPESECTICLEDLEIGAEAREMPCNHRFHGTCIEKWLGLHGSCPVCRYQMPLEEEEEEKEQREEEEVAGGGDGDGDGEDERMGAEMLRLAIIVVYSIRSGLRSEQNSESRPGESESDSDSEDDESPAQEED